MKKWAARAAKRGQLPKILSAGCLLNEEMGCMRGKEVAAAQNLVRGMLTE